MKLETILQNGSIVATYTDDADNTRYIYEYMKCYASCIEGGLQACFEDKEEVLARLEIQKSGIVTRVAGKKQKDKEQKNK